MDCLKFASLMAVLICLLAKGSEQWGCHWQWYPSPQIYPFLIPALLTGKFDVVGGMGIRPDRNVKVNFETGEKPPAERPMLPDGRNPKALNSDCPDLSRP